MPQPKKVEKPNLNFVLSKPLPKNFHDPEVKDPFTRIMKITEKCFIKSPRMVQILNQFRSSEHKAHYEIRLNPEKHSFNIVENRQSHTLTLELNICISHVRARQPAYRWPKPENTAECAASDWQLARDYVDCNLWTGSMDSNGIMKFILKAQMGGLKHALALRKGQLAASQAHGFFPVGQEGGGASVQCLKRKSIKEEETNADEKELIQFLQSALKISEDSPAPAEAPSDMASQAPTEEPRGKRLKSMGQEPDGKAAADDTPSGTTPTSGM